MRTEEVSAAIITPPSQEEWVAAKKCVRINEQIQLAYVEWGNTEAEPAILVHGYSDNSRAYSTIAPHLSDKHYHAVDLRGHGNSSKPESRYHASDFAEDIGDFIKAMGYQKACVVGHSLGSITAGVLASVHPEYVSRLVLISSTLRTGPFVDWVEAELSKARFPLDVNGEFIKTWAANPGGIDEAMLAPLRHEEAAMPECAWRGIARGLQTLDWTQAARHITAPTLIMWGDKDELMLESDQEALRRALPNAKFVRYDGLGHSMYWEEPERISRDLTAFLAQ